MGPSLVLSPSELSVDLLTPPVCVMVGCGVCCPALELGKGLNKTPAWLTQHLQVIADTALLSPMDSWHMAILTWSQRNKQTQKEEQGLGNKGLLAPFVF